MENALTKNEGTLNTTLVFTLLYTSIKVRAFPIRLCSGGEVGNSPPVHAKRSDVLMINYFFEKWIGMVFKATFV